ncbi:MAG: hypothetical protein ABEK03_02115 [Candidatus Bipolaricaulia bacterium]
MDLSYDLLPERSRVGVDHDGGAWLVVTYALSDRPPSGTRQQIVPVLKADLKSRGSQLLALDLFDEYLRLHVPIEVARGDVEASLQRALGAIEPAREHEPSEDAKAALSRFLGD